MALFTLRFQDRPTAEAAAKALNFWDDEADELRTSGQSVDPDGTPFGWHIDEIGQDPVIEPGTYDEEGNELTPPVVAEGFFINVTGRLPEPALAYCVPYGSAGRLYAGTVAEGATPEWNPPPNPARFDTYTQSDGTEWIYDQPRNPDGTYVSDDPETEQVESAMTWFRA
jgi:hypothetical protein